MQTGSFYEFVITMKHGYFRGMNAHLQRTSTGIGSFPCLFLMLQFVLVLFWTIPASYGAENVKPNVLMIAIDDLNDWIGCMEGHPQTKTPNMDRLAGQSILFSNAYCAVPACNPSRTALLTGIRPWNSGVYTNPQPWRAVLPDAVTLPQHFMAHGYFAKGGGKIFHGRYEDAASWNEWVSSGGSPPLSKKEKNNPHSRAGGVVWGNLHDAPVEEMTDYKTASWVVDHLRKDHEQPFFIGCGFKKPHMPWQVPAKYYEMFPIDEIVLPEVPLDDLDDIPRSGLAMAKPKGDHKNITSSDNWPYAVQGYLATIAFVDDQVGRVLDALKAGPHQKDTIVILWSDHGWHLGEKSHWRKFALWEEATKSVLMMKVPGLTKPGLVCDTPVDFMNIYPTLADLCGLPVEKRLDGVSMRPLLEDVKVDWKLPAITTHGRGNHAVRKGKWRYIRYADGSEELYDREKDPNEWTNLAGKADSVGIKKKLVSYLPDQNSEAANAPLDRQLKNSRKKK